MRNIFLAQRRKGAKKTFRDAVALCAFAALRESSSLKKYFSGKQSTEFRWLASQIRPVLRLHLGTYLCVVFASALVLLDPLIVRLLIDEVIPQRRMNWLPLVGAAFFFTYMGRLGLDS